MSPSGHVLLEHRGPVSLVTLNRPEARNALSGQVLRELLGALAAANRAGTEAIVLTGAGSAFCSGDDLAEAARTDAETFDENITLLQRTTRILSDTDKPSVAALNGAAIGGGLELTLACDLRIAAEQAVFGCPEVVWGLVCTNAASVLLPALVGHGRAREMLLTGRTYDAAWALAAGLVSEVVPGARLGERAIELAGELAEHAPAVRATRHLLRAAGGDATVRALERESAAVAVARRGDAAVTSLRAFAARHDRDGGRR
jgi:enoyl-CoA hydratase/carnithine racemase